MIRLERHRLQLQIICRINFSSDLYSHKDSSLKCFVLDRDDDRNTDYKEDDKDDFFSISLAAAT